MVAQANGFENSQVGLRFAHFIVEKEGGLRQEHTPALEDDLTKIFDQS